jgi:hypothetical protein
MATVVVPPAVNATTPSERRNAAIDLCVVLAVFVAVSLTLPILNPLLRRGHGLGGAFLLSCYQFSIEGLAPFALILWRRESAADFGLQRRRVGRSLALALLLAAIYDIGLSLSTGRLLWIPLARQPATRMSLAAGFPLALVGLATTVLMWGALEGFFGVYFSRKLSVALGTRNTGWLAPGALAFGLFNGLVHVVVGQGLYGFLSSFASGYAIAVIPAVTGNAWGGLLVQTITNSAGAI